ncbi:uncharacterized protein LOC143277982 isoform X2 [Babylonia areolata]|uniref:uncharacterized protein LOC143277982 isoform X2 n=1 Tax=Babylonia areolata TaxID=304850 RepID=UPI003FCF63B2
MEDAQKPVHCPDLRHTATQRHLLLDTYETEVGTVVNVTCAVDGSLLVGEGQLTCQASGDWSSPLPSCEESERLSDREIVIVAASCSVIFVVLVALIIVAACYFRAKARSRQKRNERLAATLERLSIRDPLDELVRRESRRSSYNNPAFTSSSCDENDTDKRLEVPVMAVPGSNPGVQLSRQTLSTWHYPAPHTRGNKAHVKLYKIWDSTRTRKQFVFAENLDELIMKGGEKLNLSGPIRVVLEEDGTEIDSDAVLRACAGMVFLLLEQNQVWTKPEVLLSVHEYSNNLNHYRYDIDEKL